MRKILGPLAIAAATVPLLVVQPAAAHVSWSVAGYQYAWTTTIGAGVGGYINNPGCITGGLNDCAIPFGSTLTEDGFDAIANQDPVPHTFTECTSSCDQKIGVSDPLLRGFHYELPGRSSTTDMSQIESLPNGTYVVMCEVHKWMRAKFKLER